MRVKIVKSFARIHKANPGNFGIVFLTFKDPADYDRIKVGARVAIPEIRERIQKGDVEIPVELLTPTRHDFSMLLENFFGTPVKARGGRGKT